MSHELRTPLNGILGYAQLLKLDNSLSQDQQESMATIQQCGEHLLTLINDILDLSKIEARKMDLWPTEFDFHNFIASLANVFRLRATQKGILFNYQQLSPLPTCVQADEKRLRQILLNLLGNAVKFTNSGTVTLKVGDLAAKGWEAEAKDLAMSYDQCLLAHNQVPTPNVCYSYSSIRLQVEDTGIGIEPSQLEEIFLPFQQAGKHRHSIEGTGLGLSISQKLAQMMGSEICVRSSLGKGSVFWLDLELPSGSGCPDLGRSDREGRIAGFTGPQRKVLVVDDNLVNRRLLRNLLTPLGFKILEATDGKDCLNKAVEFRPDAILMDLVMPGMDGFEATRRLRQLPELKNVVLLALSASVFQNTQEEFILAGCDHFLPKPIETKQLLERLRVHLGLEWIYEELGAGWEAQQGVQEANLPGKFPRSLASPTSYSLPSLSVPPPNSIAGLLNLVEIGDIEEILEETARLEQLDPKFEDFANKIRQFAKGFQLDEINVFLQQSMLIE